MCIRDSSYTSSNHCPTSADRQGCRRPRPPSRRGRTRGTRTTVTVSYTHLDVYKRQVRDDEARRRDRVDPPQHKSGDHELQHAGPHPFPPAGFSQILTSTSTLILIRRQRVRTTPNSCAELGVLKYLPTPSRLQKLTPKLSGGRAAHSATGTAQLGRVDRRTRQWSARTLSFSAGTIGGASFQFGMPESSLATGKRSSLT